MKAYNVTQFPWEKLFLEEQLGVGKRHLTLLLSAVILLQIASQVAFPVKSFVREKIIYSKIWFQKNPASLWAKSYI